LRTAPVPTQTQPDETMVHDLIVSPFGPLFVFFLRITDVSMATMRMILIVRNNKLLVPIIGFFEVLIWVFAVGVVVQHLTSPLHLLGYAGGFATGNLVGLLIEERLALGVATVQTIVRQGGGTLAMLLRGAGFAVTEMDARGREGPVFHLYSAIPRRRVGSYLETLDAAAPDAFVIVEEPRAVRRGWMFPMRRK
jgi:uncharacterized protein YebE (UPF0316 family)